jgi:DNA-binding HxlR family transcriptional regulator
MKGLDLHGRCPVDLAIDLVGGKWKPLILYRLRDGTMRFGELQRAIPNVTQRMLTLQLRELERDGLVVRTVYAEVPPKVEYTMTEAARGLLPIMEALGRWVIANQAELGRPAASARTERPAAPESGSSRPRAS